MKKKYGIILCLMLVTILTGCGNNTTGNSSESTANDIQSQNTEVSSSTVDSPEETPIFADLQLPTPEPDDAPETDMSSENGSSEQVDVDLSIMSSTMVYSEVYNMMTNPMDYIGKTVKINGISSTYHDKQTGKDYYASIVKDATACCAQGIEFELEQPDYPEPDKEITVVGTFQTYVEAGNMFCVLKNASIEM